MASENLPWSYMLRMRVCGSVCVCLCECVVDSFSIRQQEGLTDCVWEEGGGTVGVLTTCLCAHMLTQIHTHTRT